MQTAATSVFSLITKQLPSCNTVYIVSFSNTLNLLGFSMDQERGFLHELLLGVTGFRAQEEEKNLLRFLAAQSVNAFSFQCI